MKCLMKYPWVKLPRNRIPAGKGIMGAWMRLAARAAFRKGEARYCGYNNPVEPGMWVGGIVGLILNSHRKIEKCSEQKLRQTRRRTQAGLTPGKDDNEVWHNFCRNRLKVSMGA